MRFSKLQSIYKWFLENLQTLKQNKKIYLRGLKNLVKPLAVFGIGSVLGMAQRRIFRKSLTVFCYHDVTNTPGDFSRENDLNVLPEVFDYQIVYIKKYFNVIEPKQLMEKTLPSNAALITFDDGFKSFFTNAIPVLEKHKTPVIIFLNMGPIRGEIFWSGLIVYLCGRRSDFIEYLKSHLQREEVEDPPFLSCSQVLVEGYLRQTNEDLHETVSRYVGEFSDESDLERASHNPYVFYGNHTYTHFVSSLMSDEEFMTDVEENSKLLRAYPNYLDYFAFPFGQPDRTFTEPQVQLLLDAGIKKVFSSASSFNRQASAPFLDRIALLSGDCSPAKIKFRVLKPWLTQSLKKRSIQ